MATTLTPPEDDTAPAGGPAAATVAPDLERVLSGVARAVLRTLADEGLTPGDGKVDRSAYWLLVVVHEQGPVRLSDLADLVRLDLSTVSRHVRDLAAAGLVVKAPDPTDGRAALLTLSPEGRTVLDRVTEARRRVIDAATRTWTDDERSTLAAGLARLGADLAAAPSAPDEEPPR